jgi:hypothetical protein
LAPLCVPQSCAPALVAPGNGSVSASTGSVGHVSYFACNQGYALSHSTPAVCQSDTTWSTAAPECVPIGCTPALSAPGNGSISATSGSTGDVSFVLCDVGYTPTHSNAIVCLPSGGWSALVPQCAPNACAPALQAPGNGSLSSAVGTTGQSTSFACAQGFALSHSNLAVCLNTGVWSTAEPLCIATFCAPALVAPGNGSVSSTTGATGDARQFACDQGYALSHAMPLVCLATGAWNTAEPTCDAQPCAPNLVAPGNGSVSSVSGATGDVSHFACDAGFSLSSALPAACLPSGLWSVSEPSCDAIACSPALVAPGNGTVSAVAGTTGDVAFYACDPDYVAVGGSSASVCLTTGNWSGTLPFCAWSNDCVGVDCHNGTCVDEVFSFSCDCFLGYSGSDCLTESACPTLAAPGNGTVSASLNLIGNSVYYGCNAGYTLSHANNRTCLNTSVWTNSEPVCAPNACTPILVAPGNGSVSGVAGTTGDAHSFACNLGYALSHTNLAVCLTTGVWSTAAPTCIALPCAPLLVAPGTGSMSASSGTTGAVGTFMFAMGFSLGHANAVV